MAESNDELISKLLEIGVDADNPIVRVFSKITATMLEELENMQTARDEHETQVNHDRLRAAITELESISPEVWVRWVTADQTTMVASFRTDVENLINAAKH